MEIQLKHKKILTCIIFNIIIFIILFSIPAKLGILNNICLVKIITGKECWNCGMTRAFLSIMHLNFKEAFNYNNKVIIVFPLTIILYIYSWYKYIVKKVR